MMAPADPTNISNDSSEMPKSPNPSTTSSNKSRKDYNSVEEDAQWRQLMENHHQQCDFEKCKGKRTNGLYMCQFSNIPGNVYSQYLRHCRRLNAYKTKPCRNYYGNGNCKSGDKCPFYHNAEEQKQPPELEFDQIFMDQSGSIINASMYGIENMGMLDWNGGLNAGMGNYLLGGGGGGGSNPSTPIFLQHQQQFFPSHQQQQIQQQQQLAAMATHQLYKMVDSISNRVRPLEQKLIKHLHETSKFFYASPTDNSAVKHRSNSFSRAVGDNIKHQQLQMDGPGVNGHDFDFGRSFHLFNESYPLKNLPTDFSSATATCSSASATTITTNDENNNEGEDPPTPLATDKYQRDRAA